MPKLSLPDCPTFRRMWRDKVPGAEIAARFGLKHAGSVHTAARRYDYPPRSGEWCPHELAALDPDEAPIEDPFGRGKGPVSTDAVRAMRPDDRWPLDRDAALIRSGGRYAELCALAENWGLPFRAVQQRWHRLRVAA